MKNYKDSDYALNKYSDGIVYRFADRTVTVTLEDYLAENPGKTESDFCDLKSLSDAIYLDQVRDENAQTKDNLVLDETIKCSAPSPEDIFINAIDLREEAKKNKRSLIVAEQALNKLTDVQRRRYLLYAVGGLNERQIAESENPTATQQAVSKSILSAEEKIKKFLKATKKD